MRHFIFLLLFFVLVSCKEETSYRKQIKIKNETSSNLTIQVFPKSEYLRDQFYMYSDLGNGDYGVKNFEIVQGESEEIFITADINMEPNDLALRIFDSIYLVPANEDMMTMKFFPDSVFWIYGKSIS